jgi:spore coat protein U-like protein
VKPLLSRLLKKSHRLCRLVGRRAAAAAAFLIFLLAAASGAEAVCTVATTPVAFGNYDVFTLTDTTANGSLTVTCDQVFNIFITATIGASPNSGVFNPRQMKHATLADLLSYNVYTNAAMTRIWGDGTLGTFTRSRNVRRNRPWTAVIYGRITAGQDVSVGSYTDALVVTITP